MDKEQARFILRSFRPDGADVGDPDFAEALKLAMENRELGEWLASERAFDSEFAGALGAVNLPENLREDIMACLAAERGDFPQAEDAIDSAWIGAVASIHPPAALRDEVLAAMDRTVAMDRVPASIPIFRRLAIPLAAAAGIALAFLFTREGAQKEVVEARPVALDVVQAGFVKSYESPFFQLDEKRDDQKLLIQHLRARKLPCPGPCLPPGLQKAKGIGCRKLVVDGKQGSLICFKVWKEGVVHVVIFSRDDVAGVFPPKESPAFARQGEWASARWEDGDKVFLVLSKSVADRLPELF